MLPASYSSRADAFSREGDLSVSHRMKKFYKSYHSGENTKIDDDYKYKLENSDLLFLNLTKLFIFQNQYFRL